MTTHPRPTAPRFAFSPATDGHHAHAMLVEAVGAHAMGELPLLLLFARDRSCCWWEVDPDAAPAWTALPACATAGAAPTPVALFDTAADALTFVAPALAGLLDCTRSEVRRALRVV